MIILCEQMETKTPGNLTYSAIFVLWLPLALMWVMMGIEQPLINGIIARMEDVKINLAAFGVTFALALIIEGPIIQLLTAGTALSGNLQNYKKLLHFMHLLGGGLTAIHIIIGTTPLYGILLKTVLGVPDVVIGVSRQAFLIMIPWTAAIGYRRLWQGVLIRYGKTKAITVTMVFRLLSISLVLFIGYFGGGISGANLGALALSIGVIVGCLASFLFVLPVVRERIPKASNETDILSRRRIVQFYIPLALTSFITLAARPILTAGLGRAPYPLESLAVWPVIYSLLFIFHSIALSYQEVVVSLYRTDGELQKLKHFTFIIAAAITAVFFIVNITPLAQLWYVHVAGLDDELIGFTGTPTMVLTILPAVACFISLYRGIFVARKATTVITQAVVINGVILAGVMLVGARVFPWQGAVTAAIAFTMALAAESVYLFARNRAAFSFSAAPDS